MYDANPACAAICFVFFVFVFCFLCLNMFTAILIRHYNNLQIKKKLLSEAMAALMATEINKTKKQWTDLIFFRPQDTQIVQNDGLQKKQ